MEHSGKLEDAAKQDAAELIRETEIAAREQALAKRQQSFDEEKQRTIAKVNHKVAELNELEQKLKADEQKHEAGFANDRAALATELRDKRTELEVELRDKRAAFEDELHDKRAELQVELHNKRIGLEVELRNIRTGLSDELRTLRADAERKIAENREQQISSLEEEITKLRAKRLSEVCDAENVERDRIRTDIAKEREAWAKHHEDARALLDKEYSELAKQKAALSALQGDIHGRKMELEISERNLERREQRQEQQWIRRNDLLAEELAANLEEAHKSLNKHKQSYVEDNQRLRDSLATQTDLLGVFEQLKRKLGGHDPAEVLRELNSQTDELKRLREDLATRPTEEMRLRTQALESEYKTQKARADELSRQLESNSADVAEVGELRRKNAEFHAQNVSLSHRASIFEGSANEAQAELNRLRAAYERPAEVEARHKEIEIPHIAAEKVVQPAQREINEMTWLTDIGNACTAYGLNFNPRILKAFHTALKTSEWSPVTVLSGVSGTGKSELPRLYSHFGGIYFEPLSVQPNWDSQESMIGFFNSIDNKFDAQPVLHLLAQSQKQWSEDYPGLSDAVCLVLLDEMNLAHPELYFAEFLSKLELRRGKKGKDVPFLPVKIGAGMEPYKLPLGRNVLWAGTMNQDETTKSLSDKVIDRSIIINFPRPTELKRRLKLKPLNESNRGDTLHRKTWDDWQTRESTFSEEQINPFMQFIEKLNEALSVSGRALGHRVWQSIEYYMANYPDVRAAQEANDETRLLDAMHIAFEDQLVQKVMPKLRGIDTRGKSQTDCLDKIRNQLITGGVIGKPFNLREDFDLACELGYGQFIWQSANYLNTPAPQSATEDSKHVARSTTDAEETPPTLYMKDEVDQNKRHKMWNGRSAEKRDELRRQLEESAKAGRIVGNGN
ncbi:chromosome partitioning protein ParA [Pseudomonas shahriarae]|uniref:chromosome partitioning protein ParA n=1 Tax=Pseudomonas shahriarae TaxID=2745512 RepID=UPI0023614CC1|nr:chromosome partitioning protein ParA [Pseudomonas shahriarae]MDD0981095.1 chromosome partitioning protein ParA [Pseudomonas shahriarae]